MPYFDSYAFIGKRTLEDPEELWSRAHVLDLMNRCGIDAALVYHTLARDYEPNFGNQLLQQEMKDEPRFFGCYVAIPSVTGEMAPPETWIPRLRDENFYAVKIFPKTYHFEMNRYTVAPLLHALQAAEIPLLIDISEIDFNILAHLAEAYPNLPILVQQLRWEHSRQIVPLFERFNNLYLEFSSYQAFCILEWYCQRYGAERLLFGSEMPQKTPGAARALVDYADISATEKAMIASGNLMRLLKVEKLPSVEFSPRDEFVRLGQAGTPLWDFEVIDAHSHSGHENFMGSSAVFMPGSDPANELAKFDRLGVRQICISTWVGIWQDSVIGNQEMERTVARFPERYVPYVTIDPNFLSEAEIQATIQKYHVELKFPGLKPYYPRNKYRLTGEKFAPWFAFGNKHGLFALIHYDADTTVADINTLAPLYPDLIFMIAHAGCSYRAARNIIELAKKYPNVLAEITFTAVLSNVIEILCREIGADRVLFGTDTPMRDPAPQLGWVLYANISPEDKRKVLGLNMKKILDRAQQNLADLTDALTE
jgi:predicted TIM-barrel fold metal-dependent hydrolase